MGKLHLLLVLSTLSLAQTPCLTQGLKTKFNNNLSIAEKRLLFSDFEYLRNIRGGFGTPLHRYFGKTVEGQSYINFFNHYLTEIKAAKCYDAVACALPGHTIGLSPRYFALDAPPIFRLSILIHETNHGPHAKCPDPFLDAEGKDMVSAMTGKKLAGRFDCDGTVLGSYGQQAVFLWNIAKSCTNCSELVRQQAMLYFDQTKQRLIGKGPKGLENDCNGIYIEKDAVLR